MATDTPVAPGACNQCKATGLPILPVRYTVVPGNLKLQRPAWAGGDRVVSVDSGPYKYALRILRQGFVYLFYERHARGNDIWECYGVGQDGALINQHSTAMARPQTEPVLKCNTHGPDNTQVHYLVIEQPEKCRTAWIAFSQNAWGPEVLDQYTKDKGLRSRRMQSFEPAQMIEGARHAHGALASKDTLEGVLEYAPAMNTSLLPYGAEVGKFSDESGGYDLDLLLRESTRYPWAMRQHRAEATANHMASRAKAEGGKPGSAHVLALWDAMGIAHELNGYRNDAAGLIKKYADERDVQISALQTFEGLKTVAAEHVRQQAEDHIRRGVNDGPLQERERELQERIDSTQDPERRASYQRDLDQTRALIKGMQSQAGAIGRQFGQSQAGRSWDKYQARISGDKAFKAKLNRFLEDAHGVVQLRTKPLIKWLEGPPFLDALHDYHGTNIEDGLLFEHDIGEAIFGIGSCRAGDDKLQAWVAQCKASVDSNLLWRVMALNQDAVRAELDSALEEARQHAAAQTVAATLTWVNYTNKSLKAFADAYKKVQGFYDANQKAIAEGGNKAFGVRLTGIKKDLGIDKFSITAGDRIFRFFRIDAMADFASEKIIQHMFSIRALVNPLDSIKLIEAQARNAKPEREALLGRLKVSRTFLTRNTPAGGMNAAQARELSEAWEGMKAKGGDTAAAAVKDPRLALVVGFVEGMNFAKLLVECKTKGDAKTYASLLASGMGIGAAMLDIAATVVKSTATASSASWSYQQLKLWGGTLSAGAMYGHDRAGRRHLDEALSRVRNLLIACRRNGPEHLQKHWEQMERYLADPSPQTRPARSAAA